MNSVFGDPVTIIFMIAAVIIFFKLRSVLGTRTGHEREIDPFSPPERRKQQPVNNTGDDNIITLPSKTGRERELEEQVPVWKGVAEPDSSLAAGLELVSQADKSFSVESFLAGAKTAYEMIVTSFAKGDKKTLKSLLSKDVYTGFSSVIDQRNSSRQVMDTQFIGIDKAEIVAASMEGRNANITVNFVSEMISVLKDNSGEIIDGDPEEIKTVTDIWTFQHDTQSSDPNWVLVATQGSG